MSADPIATPTRLGHGRFFGSADQRAEVDGFALALMQPDPSRVIESHTHETAHFILHVRGAYASSARGAPRVAVTPTLIYNPPGTTHADRYEPVAGQIAGRFLSIGIAASRLAEAHGELRLLDYAACLPAARSMAIGARLLREFHRWDSSSAMIAESLCLELLGALASPREGDSGFGPAWLRRARELLHDGCGAPLTIRDVATECGVHPVHLARVFRRHCHETPGAYLRRCRIERAAARLTAGGATLTEVSIECGFVDQSHFTNAFRRCTAITPGQFRSWLRGALPR